LKYVHDSKESSIKPRVENNPMYKFRGYDNSDYATPHGFILGKEHNPRFQP